MKISTITYTYILSFFFIISCAPNTESFSKLQKELEATQAELEITKETLHATLTEIENYRSDGENLKNSLVHIVYFQLKKGSTAQDTFDLINELKSLESIEEVKNIRVGGFLDLGDKRAMSQYPFVLQMDFNSEEDYKTYQQHELHLKVKAGLKKYLGAPPVSYDYVEY